MDQLVPIGFYIGSGLFVFNWLMTLMAAWESRRAKRHSSPVWIPFIGPLCLSFALVMRGSPLWAAPLPWILDIGTMAFICVIPRLVLDAWRTSRFTCLAALDGSNEKKTVRLTLHRNGHYLLQMTSRHPDRELGVYDVGEPGTYERVDGTVVLKAHCGATRTLSSLPNGHYAVAESDDLPESHSVNGWVLRIAAGDLSQCL